DRKSTRLNSSHDQISYAVVCLKKKNHGIDEHAVLPVESAHEEAPEDAYLGRGKANSFGFVHQVDHPSCDQGDFVFFFFNDTATTEMYTLSLHDALPI